MTDREFNEQKRRLLKLADKWIGPLGLKWWNIDLQYSREGLPVKTQEDAANNWECLARTTVKWEYLKAAIAFNMPAVAEKDDETLEVCFVHELVHIFVNEMRWVEFARPDDKFEASHNIMHEERVVTQLANAFLWLRAHAERDAMNKKMKSKAMSKMKSSKPKKSGGMKSMKKGKK